MAAKLNEASSKADISSEMVELATTSLRHSTEYRRGRDEEVAKLREESNRERASRIEAAARFEGELNKERERYGRRRGIPLRMNVEFTKRTFSPRRQLLKRRSRRKME